MDLTQQVDAVSRSVVKDVVTLASGKPSRTIRLRQTFSTPHAPDHAALWDALTKPERLATWFAPVSGDLRTNGRFSITGNASGTVTECHPPRGFSLSWEVGDVISAVRVNLESSSSSSSSSSPSDGHGKTVVELRHTFPVDAHWKKYGPGAGGVGWDMVLLGLAMHLRGMAKPSDEEWAASDEAAVFAQRASDKWREAAVQGGEDEAWAQEAADRTTAFYVPGWEAGSSTA
ncbi:hypothetical protein MY10362_008945 [Beauveria mimosiformis]